MAAVSTLAERIDAALRTTPATGHTHKLGEEKWDHHPKPGERGHTYTYTCALCRDDVEALTNSLLTVVTDELKADWSRYRSRVLQEAWETARDADGGPLLKAMNAINELAEQDLSGEPSLADQLTDREQRYLFLDHRAHRTHARLKDAEAQVAEHEKIRAAVTEGKSIGRPLTASDVRVAHDITRKALANALDAGLHLNWPQLVEQARRSHKANEEWHADVQRVRDLHAPVQHMGQTWCGECSVRRSTGPKTDEWVAFIPHPCNTLNALDNKEPTP